MSLNNDLTGEWKEEAAMRESVKKHGGFYIARYEAGKGENNTVVSKKGADVWNNIAWGDEMNVIGTEGAVYRSRQMYKDSNSVTSTLCYGVQWDAVMNFMSDVKNINDESKLYINDSTSMGYYAYDSSGNLIEGMEEEAQPTGYYAVKNIYDMAGNVIEWTMEAETEENRSARGGCFVDNCSASYRSYGDPVSLRVEQYGFRVALYLK